MRGENLVSISQLLLHHTTATISLLQKGTSLFQCILVCVAFTLSIDKGIMCMFLSSLFTFQLCLSVPQSLLVCLDVSLSFRRCSIGMLQTAVKVQYITFQLLLHPDSLSLSLSLSLHC